MTRTRAGASGLASLGIVLLILASSPALAGWQEDYKDARTALNEGKHNKAENLFRSAIAQKGAEKANAIKASGMFFEPYLPHFYLGMTLFQQKSYAEAAREFDLSESQGVVVKDAALMAQLSQMRSTAKSLAQAAAPPSPPPPAPPPSTISEAPPPPAEGAGQTGTPTQGGAAAKPETGKQTEPPSAIKGGGSKPGQPPSQGGRVTAEPLPSAPKPPAPTGPDPALTRAIDAAASDIAAAQKLAAESGDLLAPAEKDQLASAASAILKAGTPAEAQFSHEKLRALRADLGRRADQRRQEREANAALEVARKETAGVLRDAEALMADSRAGLKPSERGRLTQEIASLREARSADDARKAARTVGADVSGMRKVLQERAAQAAQPPKPSGPDPAIAAARRDYAAGVEAYFGGDFDRAIPALVKAGDAIQDDPGIHALLGSALYKRYLLTRPEDPSLKARAEEAFRTALGIRPGLTLDAKYYPPKVIALFKQVAAGSRGPSGQ